MKLEHLPSPVSFDQLLRRGVVRGPIQSILRLSDESFSRVLTAAGR